jgi:hypothetical protein
MLRPFLIIGVGGSGGKTLRGLKFQLELMLRQKGWKDGLPQAWQFLHIDTPIAQDGADYALPFLPAQEYRGLVSGGSSYSTVFNSIVESGAIPASVRSDIRRQFPDPKRVRVDVTKGAGQFRAVGRTVVLSAPGEVKNATENAIARMTDARATGELQNLGELIGARADAGASASPTVIVISSIAGGSGAGQVLDVIEIAKSTVKQYPWSNQFFSVLFAPDVFDQLDVTAGMPGNALAAISEAMNGFWTETPSEATLQLLASKGISPSYGDAMNKVGAAYPFIVGRRNSKVTFANQGAVYSAVATSLASWITDDHVQDSIDAYASGNWQARVGAAVLPDASRLMRANDQSPPFSALGFGRVTLGRDRFLEYSAERIARSTVDRILVAHTEEDPSFDQRTEDEWIEVKAAAAYENFIRTLRLNEETEEHNDVIDELRDATGLEEISQRLRMEVEQLSSDNLDKAGGLDLNTWAERITSAFTDLLDSYLVQDTENRQRRLDEWIKGMPDHILRVVSTAIADNGLPVVVKLLLRLSRDLTAAADGLTAEAGTHAAWVARIDSLISEDLQSAPNQESIRPKQDAVQTAFDRIEQAVGWASEARLRKSAATLLNELRIDFIEPLRRHLSGTLIQLSEAVEARKTIDGRDNDFKFWPTREEKSTPRKYEPAPNERLLVDSSKYSEEFERLVVATTKATKYLDGIFGVISDVVTGPDDDGFPEDKKWSFITAVQSWKPEVTADQDRRASDNRKPQFQAAGDLDTFVRWAREWVGRDGKAFGAYIHQNLNSYFDQSIIAPDEYVRRVQKFREEFTAALGASEPLVKLNPALLSAVHQKSINEPPALVFSTIPFKEGTELYALTKQILAEQHLWDDNKSPDWFGDHVVDGIEIFAMSAFPYQPIVMDSVMDPIARSWLEQSTKVESREAFWQFKRGRLLAESIPADATVLATILRGWYVARAFGLLGKTDRSDAVRGPELTVWDRDSRQPVAFPHPLLHHAVAQAHDYVGIVAQSLMIAMPLCSVSGDLSPLRPYHVLMDLGGQRAALAGVVSTWLQNGTLPERAPTPDPTRVGSATDTLAVRQAALQRFFEEELEAFRADVVNQNLDTSVYDYPVSWEIRDHVETALLDLKSSVSVTRQARSEF